MNPNKFWRECKRKKVFYSEVQAEHTAEQIRQRPLYKKNRFMIAFKCKHCTYWHLGHLSPESKKYKEIKASESK